MLNFFKNFGRGILYILVLPLLAVALVVYAVVALFIFVFLAFKGLFLFFTGRSLYEDLPEDIEAKKRLGINNEQNEKPQVQLTPNPEPQPLMEQEDDISTDPFYVPTYLKPQEEQEFEDEPPVEQSQDSFDLNKEETEPEDFDTSREELKTEEITPEPEQIKREEEVISLEKSNQNPTILDINNTEEEEDEDANSGINIDFN